MNIYYIFLAVYLGVLLLEVIFKKVQFNGISTQDNFIDFWVLFQVVAITGPLITLSSAGIEGWLFPEAKNSLVDTPIWIQFISFLLLEDMVQYWWHRSAHTFKILWPLHRVHHAAPYLGVRVQLRNGLFYNLFMPNVWLSGFLVFLGFGKVYVAYYLLKALVTAGAHSEFKWDAFLYRYKWQNPVAWVVERTISTPATHFAHHALSDRDSIGHYNGNFGNLLFFWDVIFGTAVITRKYPPAYGIQEDYDLGAEKWYVQLFYPIFRTKRIATNTK